MKNNIVLLLLTFNLFCSCMQGQKGEKPASKSIDKESYKKLDGEWAVVYSWKDPILVFKNRKDSQFEQEVFPTFNTITFNKKNNTIDQNTYGEFGCGTASHQNLEIRNSKWHFENGQLHLSFDYSDYYGVNTLNHIYNVERKGQTLTLKKVK